MWPLTLFRVKVLLRKRKTSSPLLTFYLLITTSLLFPIFLNFLKVSASPLVQQPDNGRGAKLLIEEFLSDGDDDDFVPVTVRPRIASSDLNSDHSIDDKSSSRSSKSLSAKSSTSSHFQHKFLPFRVKIFNESEERPLPLLDDDQLAEHTTAEHYQADPLLNFDAPLVTENFFDCTVRYQHYWRYHSPPARDPYEDELLIKQQVFVDLPTPLQVEITGRRCDLVSLVLLQLKHKRNITQLVLRDTAVRSLDRHLFADARLTSLQRVDILNCRQLAYVDQRAFDELASLQVLRLFRCPQLRTFHRQALLGAKALRSFLWAENGYDDGGSGQQPLHSELFINLTRATAKHYLPALEQLIIIGSSSTTSTSKQLHFLANNSATTTDHDLKLTKDDLSQLTQIRSLQLVGVHLRFIHPLTFTFLAANLHSLHIVDSLGGSNGNHHHHHLSLDSLIALFSTLAKLGAKRVKLGWVNLSGSVSVAENSGSLPKQLLLPLGKLPVRTLLLRRIGLTSITVDDFPPMPNLERLVLDDNPLVTIADHAFDSLEALVTLSLAGNRLQSIRSELFYNLPKLSYLDLSGSPSVLETLAPLIIAPRTFVGLNLRVLHLSYQYLDPLPNKAFLGLHKTEELYLRGCALTSIEYLTFFFLKSLRLLDLSENGLLIESLRQTHEDSFFGLESVEVVKMAGNNLLSDDLPHIFARMHERVQELDLSGNLLEYLSAEHFTQFGELRSLNLSGNRITPWTNGSIFAGNAELVELDLRNNHLSTISSSMMEDFYRVANLSFGGNPLNCDCNSELLTGGWLASTLEKPILYMDSANPLLSREQYYCVLGEEEDEEEEEYTGDKAHQRRSNLQQYRRRCAQRLLTSRRAGHLLLNSYLVILFTLCAFLISFAVLAVAFVYYGELNQLFATYFWSRSARGGDDEEDSTKYEYDAFVSYNVADSEWIFSELVPNIERSSNASSGSLPSNSGCQRVRLCVYDRDFIAGRPISECILESIRQSRRVILVISNAFIRSPWCRYETDLAAHHSSLSLQNGGRSDGLVLIKLEQLETGLSVPLQLDYLLRTRIYLQWDAAAGPEERQKFWSKLKVALGIERVENARKADKSSQTKVSKLKRIKDKLSQLMDDLLSDFWLSDLQLPKEVPEMEAVEAGGVPEKAAQQAVEKSPNISTAKRIKFKGRRKDLWRLKTDEDALAVESASGQVHCTRYCSMSSEAEVQLRVQHCDEMKL